MGFGDCIKKLNMYTNLYGWKCNINSWIRKQDNGQVWVIILTKGPVVVQATGSSLVDAGEQTLKLLEITEQIALSV